MKIINHAPSSRKWGGGARASTNGSRWIAFLAILLFLPLAAACGTDAETDAAQDIPEDATPEELMAELQSINQELMGIQEQAMQNPELEERRAALEEQLMVEMRREDPEVEAKIQRAETLEGELREAQETGEQEGMEPLVMEWQQLQATLQQTQERALDADAMSEALEDYQDSLLAEMNRVDPRAESLIARAEAIMERLEGSMPQIP